MYVYATRVPVLARDVYSKTRFERLATNMVHFSEKIKCDKLKLIAQILAIAQKPYILVSIGN